MYIVGAFTLAEISGIQISVLHRDQNLGIFTMCGHKNLTNYRDQHRTANRNTSCDYLGISMIICITADVWTLEQIILVFSIPSFQASISKQGQCLISGMCSSVTRIIPLSDQREAKISQYFNRDGNLDLSCVWMLMCVPMSGCKPISDTLKILCWSLLSYIVIDLLRRGRGNTNRKISAPARSFNFSF